MGSICFGGGKFPGDCLMSVAACLFGLFEGRVGIDSAVGCGISGTGSGFRVGWRAVRGGDTKFFSSLS